MKAADRVRKFANLQRVSALPIYSFSPISPHSSPILVLPAHDEENRVAHDLQDLYVEQGRGDGGPEALRQDVVEVGRDYVCDEEWEDEGSGADQDPPPQVFPASHVDRENSKEKNAAHRRDPDVHEPEGADHVFAHQTRWDAYSLFPTFIQNRPHDLTLRKPAADVEDRSVFFSDGLDDSMLDQDVKMMPYRGVVHPEFLRQLMGVQGLRRYSPQNPDAGRTTPRPLEQPPDESPRRDLGQSA